MSAPDTQKRASPTTAIANGNTPRHSRFKKGQSGNPGGRPKGARGLKADLEAVLNERVSVTANGRRKRVRKQRLVVTSLIHEAIKSRVGAADKLLGLMVQVFGVGEEKAGPRELSTTDRLILERALNRTDTTGQADEWVEVTIVDDGAGGGEALLIEG